MQFGSKAFRVEFAIAKGMRISIRRIVEICSDIVSGINEHNFRDVDGIIPITTHVGKFSKFLNALRTDTHRTRTVSKRYIEKLANINGLNPYVYEDFSEFLEDLGVVEIKSSGRVKIIISSIQDIYSLCGKKWLKETLCCEDAIDEYVVLVLERLYRPTHKKDLTKEFSGNINIEAVIGLLMRLELIRYSKDLDVYYSPRFFGSDKKKIGDFLQDHKAVSSEFIDEMEKIESRQGYPLTVIEPYVLSEIKRASIAGILDPVKITVGPKDSVIFLFTPDTGDDMLALTKETAAHFRFNERFADTKYGRLKSAPTFLGKLISQGNAGSATNIAMNYVPLELKGVVATKEGGWKGYPYMICRKTDVLKQTRELLIHEAPNIKASESKRSLSDWIKNPTETRSASELLAQKREKDKLDILRILKDEVR